MTGKPSHDLPPVPGARGDRHARGLPHHVHVDRPAATSPRSGAVTAAAVPSPYAACFTDPIRGEWIRRAACIGKWALMEGPDTAAAKRLCFTACAVRADCRAWVLPLSRRADPGGVVAGLTRRERNRLRSGALGRKSQAARTHEDVA